MPLPKERYMTVMGGYKLDMHNHGKLVHEPLAPRIPGKDYGADPIGDGTFRMVPSGDIVSYEERCKRLEQ
jgi:hypothetical protein